LIAVIFLVLQVVVILVAVARKHLSDLESPELLRSAATDGYLLSLSTLVTTVVCCALIVGVVKLKRGSILSEYLCFKPVPLKTLLKWIGLLLVFIALSDSLTALLGRPVVPPYMAAAYATANPVWMLWLAVIIAAPLFEEMFFRGFLFKGFESSFMGPIGAVALTASLWAVIHLQYDWYSIATIFCLGLLIGAARVATASIFVPIGLHAASDLVATIEAVILG